MKKTHHLRLSDNKLMFLIFTSEFLICFLCLFSHLLPLYAILSISGFLLSLWYYRDRTNENFKNRH